MNNAHCGRVRKKIMPNEITTILDQQLRTIEFSVLSLNKNEKYSFITEDREYALILIYGECNAKVENTIYHLGPRANPFNYLPYGLFVSRENNIHIDTLDNTLIGIGSAPAAKKTKNTFIEPDGVKKAIRGMDNWTREVRMVCWSDNTEGNMLLAGETCTPSGNWSSIPPHRHQFNLANEEAAYEEAYYFQFSRPQGFGIVWQFDDDENLDQSFSVKTHDTIYMNKGYHPVACAPGSTLYHLSLMSGSQRISLARVHPDFQFLLEEHNMENQFTPNFHNKGSKNE